MLTENKTGHTNKTGVASCKNSVLTDKKVITKTVSVFVTPGSVTTSVQQRLKELKSLHTTEKNIFRFNFNNT